MQSFDREIQSLKTPGNKATDLNKFDNCKKSEHLNKISAETYLIQLVSGDNAFQKLQ